MGRPKTTDRISIEALLRAGHSGQEIRQMAERLGIGRERIGHILQQVRAEARTQRKEVEG